MNFLKRLLPASLTLAGLSVAQGANVVITSLAPGPNAEPAKKVVTSTTANLPQNSIVRVGFFNLPGGNDTTILTVGLFAALQAIFTAVGEDAVSANDGTTGPVRVNATGGIGGSIQNISDAWFPTATPPATTPLYAWVFAQPTADATATQWAIFRDPSWVMPTGIGSINLQTWQINQTTEVFKGTLDNVNNQIIMANVPVPEPTSALLGMVGLGLACRRRRA